jgi:hypothetical protein
MNVIDAIQDSHLFKENIIAGKMLLLLLLLIMIMMMIMTIFIIIVKVNYNADGIDGIHCDDNDYFISVDEGCRLLF